MKDSHAISGFAWRYDRTEMIADGVVHAIGLSAASVALAALLLLAFSVTEGFEFASVMLYAGALAAGLGLSAAYNMWPVCRVKWLLRRFDHGAIYLLIAGTYMPFLAQIQGRGAFLPLLAGIWGIALVGIALKLFMPGRFDRVSIALYLGLGWSGCLAYRDVIAVLPSTTLYLLALGGIVYSAGVVFHVWESLRFQNALWHCFVLLGTAFHYAAVVNCVTAA
jgi:hemolysin III